MHVALVHMRHAGTGGTEAYLNHLARFLLSLGHEVTVICRSHETSPDPRMRFVVLRRFAPTATARMDGFARDVEAHLRSARYDVVFGLGKTYAQDIIRLGGGCHATYLEKAHAATLSPWGRCFRRGARKQRHALVIEERALAPGSARRVIVNAEMVKRDVIARYGLDPERIEVIYNGVDLERFRPDAQRRKALRSECGWTEQEFVILFLGTGYGRKGLDTLLRAFSRLLGEQPQARLLVVGYDSSQARYSKLTASLNCAQRVRFLGGRRDVEACYAASDLYVLPTRYDPFANTTLEALASGLPVITTTSNGGGEVIREGIEGSVLDHPDDDETLAEALRLWCVPERNQSGKVAARKCAEGYSWETMARHSYEILQEVALEKGCL